jgi:uncharacterized protein (TIGR00299 family) protein
MVQAETEKVLLVEPLGGLSGDMFLGAFLDLGLPPVKLRESLGAVGLERCFELKLSRVRRHAIAAVKVDFPALSGAGLRPAPATLAEVEELLGRGRLPEKVAATAGVIFRLLAAAEARVHGVSPEKVHFHEVGDYDTLADIVGTAVALEYFAPRRLQARPVPLGTGFTDSAHGRLPLPVPAVAVLLEGVAVQATSISRELVTPTGAAIYRYLVDNLPVVARQTVLNLRRFGCGAGSRELAERPNLLRLGLAEIPAAEVSPPETSAPEAPPAGNDPEKAVAGAPATAFAREPVVLLETLVDDLSPEKSADLCEHLRSLETLEVVARPVQMKKGRLGLELMVMVAPAAEAEIVEEIFRHSPTLGLRRRVSERYRLERETREFITSFGRLRGKVARDLSGRVCNFKLEHDDLVARAREKGLSPARLETLATAEIIKLLN